MFIATPAQRASLYISDAGTRDCVSSSGMTGRARRRPRDTKAVKPFRAGVGIPGMIARMQQFGGNLHINSGANGTAVHATVPIGKRQRQQPEDSRQSGIRSGLDSGAAAVG